MVKNKILKFIFYIVLTALTSMHIAKSVFTGISLSQLSIVVFIMLFIAISKENRILYFYSFFSMAILNMLLSEYPGELAPALLLFIALLYKGDIKNLILSLSVIPSCLIINSFYSGYDKIQNIPVGIIGNLGILLFLYFAVIKQPEDIEKLSKTTPLTKRQLLILKQLAKDIPRKNIPESVKDQDLWKLDLDREKFTLDIINNEIFKIKKELEISNEMCLGIWYNKQVDMFYNLKK